MEESRCNFAWLRLHFFILYLRCFVLVCSLFSAPSAAAAAAAAARCLLPFVK
jgi:hypothetical protein